MAHARFVYIARACESIFVLSLQVDADS